MMSSNGAVDYGSGVAREYKGHEAMQKDRNETGNSDTSSLVKQSPIELLATMPKKGSMKKRITADASVEMASSSPFPSSASAQRSLPISGSSGSSSTPTKVPNASRNNQSVERRGGASRPIITDQERFARSQAAIERAVKDPFNDRILDVLYNMCVLKKREAEQAAKRRNPPPPPPPETAAPVKRAAQKKPQSVLSTTSEVDAVSDSEDIPRQSKSSHLPTLNTTDPKIAGNTKAGRGDRRPPKRNPPVPVIGEGGMKDTRTHTRCNLCNVWFTKKNKQAVKYHVLYHCPWKEHHCKFCIYAHHEPAKVKKHQTNKHKANDNIISHKSELLSAGQDYYLKQCFPNYDTGRLTVGHALNHINMCGDKLKCCVCEKLVFDKLAAYHIVDKHMDVRLHTCTIDNCQFKAVNRRTLLIHVQASHLSNAGANFPACKLDFTVDSDFTIKSFFPEKIDLNKRDCKPEFLKMAEIRLPSFDKDTHLKPLLAEQDGFSDYLMTPLDQPTACAVCAGSGVQVVLHNVYDSILHMKSHVQREKQWKCPLESCTFSSHYKIEVDLHLLDDHESINEDPINRWHWLLPTFYAAYHRCFPYYTMPLSTLRPDHRAVPVDIIKKDEDLSFFIE